MNAANSLDGLLTAVPFLNANPLKFRIALELVRGDRERAKRLFLEALDSASDTEYRCWLTEWGEEHGLT